MKIKIVLVSAVSILSLFLSYPAQAEETSAVKYFDEVLVTAMRTPIQITDLPSNISVITKTEIENAGVHNAAEALIRIGGLNLGEKGTLGNESTIRLRSGGNSSGQTLIMIDGMPINSTSLGFSDLSAIPSNKIERIEVVRGAVSSLYGANALGGVVNIITKEPSKKDKKASVKINCGSFKTRNYSATYSFTKDKLSTMLNIGRDYSGGWRLNNDYTNTNIMFKPSYDLGNAGKIGAQVFYLNGNLGVPGTNTTPIAKYDNYTERATSSPEARQTDRNLYSQVHYEKSLGANSSLKTQVYNRLETRTYKYPGATIDTLSESISSGFDVQANLSDSLVAGSDFKWDIFRRTNNTTANVAINEQLFNISLFVQKTFRTGKLNTTIGLRNDYHTTFKNQLNPSLLVEYGLTEKLELTGNLGRAFRAPTFEDLHSPFESWPPWGIFPAGNTQGYDKLLPETAWSGDVGIKYYLDNKLLCKLTFYGSNINNLIQWSDISTDPMLQEYRPQNIGLAYNQGIELEFNHVISKNISHKLNYIFLESNGKGEFDPEYVLLNYSPEHNLNYNLNFYLESKTNIIARGRYVANQYSSNDKSGTNLPEYLLIDFRISQALGSYELFLAINNILDTKYKTRNEYPLPGKNFAGGINIKF